MPPLRITTWNVNGIRNPFGYQPWRDKRTFDAMFDLLEADIVIMQELKIQRKDLHDDMVLVPGWDCFFSLPKHKKGYSGVAIYTRTAACAPLRAEEGVLGVLCPPGSSTPYRDLPADRHIGGYPTDEQIDAAGGVDPAALDAEGRCVALEFAAFVLLGVYSPANSNGLRDDFRHAFFSALDARVRNLARAGKRVVLCGDLNVSRGEIDTANTEESMRKEGISHDEYVSMGNRRIFNQMLEGGEVVLPRDEGREAPVLWDTTREFHPQRKGMYTHWEQKINARPGNFGARIDFVLCSLSMKEWVQSADIQEGLMGSDHCPVYAVLKQNVIVDGKEIKLSDLMNLPGMFENGKRLRDWTLKDSPAFSGRLLPEFDRRRSIKDMFSRKPANSQPTKNGQAAGEIVAIVDHSSTSSMSKQVQEKLGTDGGANTEEFQQSQTSISSQLNGGSQPRSISSPEKKRPAAGPPPGRSNKKKKQSVSAQTQNSPVKGQQSLKGFFKPTTTLSRDESNISTKSVVSPSASPAPLLQEPTTDQRSTSAPLQREQVPGGSEGPDETSQHEPSTRASSALSRSSPSLSPNKQVIEGDTAVAAPPSPPFIDPIVSKESWDKLFTKPPAPRCEDHDEPCISLTTKKPGANCGRAFWICPRPNVHLEERLDWMRSTGRTGAWMYPEMEFSIPLVAHLERPRCAGKRRAAVATADDGCHHRRRHKHQLFLGGVKPAQVTGPVGGPPRRPVAGVAPDKAVSAWPAVSGAAAGEPASTSLRRRRRWAGHRPPPPPSVPAASPAVVAAAAAQRLPRAPVARQQRGE
uniref:DNA-(apurinic or apyrimidinic site) endonuclease 2 n=1 Tax=Neofusicoccum ribis TaxID=45134 RepID=A0A343JZS0_9PEZI|nr:DNA lyase [Neofusicoccum ribis]